MEYDRYAYPWRKPAKTGRERYARQKEEERDRRIDAMLARDEARSDAEQMGWQFNLNERQIQQQIDDEIGKVLDKAFKKMGFK